MALKATIHKAALQVADMDRGYYAEHALTVARHPSETDERMMVRLLAFALNAHEQLAFGKGLSDATSPTCGRRTSPARSRTGSRWASPTRSACCARAGARGG